VAVGAQIELEAGDHVVQFYERDQDLVTAVSGHLAAALSAGDAAIVVATPEHRRAFDDALTAAGIDVVEARRVGALIVADAGATLDRFMGAGGPDPAAFDDVVGGLVRDAVQSGRVVRAYGEMVALLWEAGLVTAAIELEELWNDLGERVPFSLYCAYPAHLVAADAHAGALVDICHAHTAIVGAGSPIKEVTQRFECSPLAPRHARRLVTNTLRSWNRADIVDVATLAISELAANAVIHARSDFVVTITRDAGRVRIAVIDSSPATPVPSDAAPTATSGRGLALVAGVAARWGHDRLHGGKQVWAEFVS
jgi:anti-sigma regulatory factor (Ser/Thr protein kinase)